MASSASNAGNSVGQKVKGAAETVHGIGESLRGGAMDFVDSATGSHRQHPETQRGAAETEQGIARMENHNSVNTSTTHPHPHTHGSHATTHPATGAVPQIGTTLGTNHTKAPTRNNDDAEGALGSTLSGVGGTAGAGYGGVNDAMMGSGGVNGGRGLL
ncbi:hypothetical protein BXZ70DRAFT_1012896 [Cristinia sonorae]|uniref:Uncharacterized protein n=1 Tax=Cristinia sonorae TaxID=1940300 RepID=A0A8K0UD81_9AGAR|nr:hypothetical protein BXZ70DRAFT_1012896 [Cristinia sonorae]